MRLALVLVALLGGCQKTDPPPGKSLQVWEPVDEGFKGCEGG